MVSEGGAGSCNYAIGIDPMPFGQSANQRLVAVARGSGYFQIIKTDPQILEGEIVESAGRKVEACRERVFAQCIYSDCLYGAGGKLLSSFAPGSAKSRTPEFRPARVPSRSKYSRDTCRLY
jgi:hypothetical protein